MEYTGTLLNILEYSGILISSYLSLTFVISCTKLFETQDLKIPLKLKIMLIVTSFYAVGVELLFVDLWRHSFQDVEY